MSGQDWEQLTLFPADSPASPLVWLESEKVKGMTVTSGLRCSELSESCARIASSVRMYLESSALPPGRWSRIWSRQAITWSCSVLKLRLSALGTDGRGCFLLRPTPNTMDKLPPKSPEALEREATGTRAGRRQPCNLRDWVAWKENMSLWPTPKAADYKGSGAPGTASAEHDLARGNLKGVVLYTTPCAADSEGSTGGNNHRSLRTEVSWQLNPDWTEWLMGFPPGWTKC